MTLIVSRVVNRQIKIISDSKVTDQNVVRNNPLMGNLKSFILNPQLAVSFSGNVHYAEKFLSIYFSNQIKTFNDLKYCCLALNNESDDKTDFIIASLTDKPSLHKITNGRIEDNLTNAWIGDKVGFNKYQGYFHTSNSNNVFSKMTSAFNKVISDESIESVSDFQITVDTVYHDKLNADFFIYAMNMSMNLAPQSHELKLDKGKNKVSVKIPFGGPEIGSFGSSYLRSYDFLKPAIAIHFPQGKFGVLFCPMISFNKGIIIKEQDGETFAQKIKDVYDIPLEGLVASQGFAIKRIVIK